MNPRRLNSSLLLATAIVGVAITGCVVGPNYQRPATAPPPPAFKELPPPSPPNGTWKQAQPSDAALKGKWWEIYNDPQLNALQDRVAVSNQTLKAAAAQYLQMDRSGGGKRLRVDRDARAQRAATVIDLGLGKVQRVLALDIAGAHIVADGIAYDAAVLIEQKGQFWLRDRP